MDTSEKQSSFLEDFIEFMILFVLLLTTALSLLMLRVESKTEALRFDNEVRHADRNTLERLTFDGDIDEYTKLYATAKVNDVPERYVNMLDDWDIVVTTKPISDVIEENDFNLKESTIASANNKFSGLCSYKQKTIYINAEESNIDQAVDHEIGHAIDKILEYPSKTKEFIEIYNKEKELVFDDGCDYYKLTNLEYWAECFELFLNDDESLRNKGPETYDYMVDVLVKEIVFGIEEY